MPFVLRHNAAQLYLDLMRFCVACAFAMPLLLSACASDQPIAVNSTTPTRHISVDLAVAQIDAAVEAFGKAHPGEYPRTMRELCRFAACTGHPLDLRPFSKITLERPERTYMSISYETRDPFSAGLLAYSTVY